MKKYIVVILIMAFILTVTACSDTIAPEEDVISQIYEIDTGSLGVTDNAGLNYMNVIPFEKFLPQESMSGKTMTFATATKTYSLTYDTTIFYPHRDLKVHSYKIDGTDEGEIALREDGSLFRLYDEQICLLDIEETDLPDMVRMALEPAISDLLDVSKYESVMVNPSLSIEKEGRFGAYTFYYYNMEQGYYSDVAMVFVRDDGRVTLINNEDINLDASTINVISKSREEEMIQAKLKSMCSTSTMQYREHKIQTASCSPKFTFCDGELCISYTVVCEAYDMEKEKDTSFARKLVIPVHLLTNK